MNVSIEMVAGRVGVREEERLTMLEFDDSRRHLRGCPRSTNMYVWWRVAEEREESQEPWGSPLEGRVVKKVSCAWYRRWDESIPHSACGNLTLQVHAISATHVTSNRPERWSLKAPALGILRHVCLIDTRDAAPPLHHTAYALTPCLQQIYYKSGRLLKQARSGHLSERTLSSSLAQHSS
jgi:hypothetical protein